MPQVQSDRAKKLHVLARELNLTREDRIDIARGLLWRDLESWSDLTPEQEGRLLDAFEGYMFITHLIGERRPQ